MHYIIFDYEKPYGVLPNEEINERILQINVKFYFPRDYEEEKIHFGIAM